MANGIEIPSYFNQGDVDGLFVVDEFDYESMHATTFERRKVVKLEEPIKLCAELPDGAFIAGGFMRASIIGLPVSNYDIFFRDQSSLLNLVRRIQNAPKGSFLEGYSSIGSVREFATQDAMFMKFTHPTKPPLKLFRVRWFDSATEYLDMVDLSISRFTMDSELTVRFTQQSIDDAKYKRIRMIRANFTAGTGLRIKRFETMGYLWHSDYYDTFYRQDYIKNGNQLLDAEAKLAKSQNLPIPTNDGDFGLFAP